MIEVFLKVKYRNIARSSGYFHAAKLLRKQGYPIHIAMEILL